MKGKKTGGRLAGTPNKRSRAVEEKLAALNVDPIEGMALLATDPATPVAIRARLFSELAGYVAPKRKAIEIDASDPADASRHQVIVRFVRPDGSDGSDDCELNGE